MKDTLMTLYIKPDMPGIDDIVMTITRLRREGWSKSDLPFQLFSSVAYQTIPEEAFTDPLHHRLKEYVRLSREFGLIRGAKHKDTLRGYIRSGIMSGVDETEVIRRILFSPYYSAHELEITSLIRSLARRNNRVSLTLFPRMFRYKAFGVVETGSGYPRRPEHQESKVCLLAGYLRVQEEIRASQARLALLNTEVEKENAQEYARSKIPASQLAHFRLWFTRRFGNDTSRLMESVDTYCEEQDPVMDEKPAVLPLPRGHLPHADIRMRSPSFRREVSVRDVHVQSQFRELVDKNFGSLCAVSGGVLEAAHIEPTSVAGCYNASNGILLSPTFHRLFDTNMMGIDPDTLQVHFASGIEFPEYEGVCIKPLFYNLDKNRLGARWLEFKVKSPAE